jgi:tetratricopeptide (TPR) repeat protein
MHKSLILILLLSITVLAGDSKVVTFRLKKSPDVREKVRALSADEDGMKIEYLGTRRRAFVRWSDLVESDAKRLRIGYKLDLTEDEKLGLIPGDEVFFNGGMSVRGLVLKKDEEKNQVIIRTDGMVLAYPLDRLDRVEKIKIRETEVYDEEEIYIMRLERRPPTNWGDHRRLADHMYEIGNYRKAEEHYNEALRLRPELRPKVEPRLAEIKDILDDEDALAVIQKAKSIANLWGRYKDAKAMLEQYGEERPGSKRRVTLVMDEIEELRIKKLTVRFHRVKNREADRAIKSYLLKKQPTLEEARSWIASGFKDDLESRLKRSMGLEKEEIEVIAKTKAKGAAHWTSYGPGSFVIDPKAKRGKSTDKAVRGDPERWWRAYGDINSRSAWLRAYAAEKLPGLFEVVSVRKTACHRCGGSGQVKQGSIHGIRELGGAHEWMENCPRCFGAGHDRGIGYR